MFQNEGITFYIDFERIRKVDGYVYWWDLSDFPKPVMRRYLSSTIYYQGDCKLFRVKGLSVVIHKQPMGRDVGEVTNYKNPEWKYTPPNSVIERTLKAVCVLAK